MNLNRNRVRGLGPGSEIVEVAHNYTGATHDICVGVYNEGDTAVEFWAEHTQSGTQSAHVDVPRREARYAFFRLDDNEYVVVEFAEAGGARVGIELA